LSNPAAYRFRQRPGSSNSLGLVKFMFPNTFNVYLHDTPADSLFARAIAVVQPRLRAARTARALAQYVLAISPRGPRKRFSQAMHGRGRDDGQAERPLPVYLGYWTARVSADGVLQFRSDLIRHRRPATHDAGRTADRLRQHAARRPSAANLLTRVPG
jgi:murein L,D-transpeptidase YcbB/YkuD